mmetsp:Transcript_146282/g.380201  ORF Transcript_146282/g.380201 Transcript_146282/m.380201 type:complete len:314 (+) Transcript_146282:53-994(+)
MPKAAAADAAAEARLDQDMQRVKVPLPKNLGELHHHAAQFYGSPGRGQLRLHHNGRLQELQESGIPRVREFDVVHVAWGAAGQDQASLPISTQRADFVQHPLPSLQSPRKATSASSHRPFHGASSYRGDFVQQPLSARRQPFSMTSDPAKRWDAAKEPTGTTTYVEHFPSHSLGSSSVPTRFPQSANLDSSAAKHLPPAPFCGQSRYTEDYILHSPGSSREDNNSATAKVSRMTKVSPAFEGETTYGSTFQPHAMPSRWRSPPARIPPLVPFTARTEHQHEFIERRPERLPEIFLEPHPLSLEAEARTTLAVG